MPPWYPLGPDFVYSPIRENFLRLSRRNERGQHGTVIHIAVSPHAPSTILAIDGPTSGGSAMHGSEDGGETWRSLLDPLHHSSDPNFGPGVDPTCSAFHPGIAGTVYVGTGNKRALYRSTGGFAGWTFVHAFAGAIRAILIDPRTTTLATTSMLVATSAGLFFTTNGGGSWTEVAAGSFDGVTGDFPAGGTPSLWASAGSTGLLHSTNGTAWTNVSSGAALAPGASGPLPSPANIDPEFATFRVDFSRVEPQRVYAWAVKEHQSLGLYRSNNGAAGPWTRIAATLPDPWQALRNCVFAVAPQSTGSGSTDILLFGGIFFNRSIDGGATWETISYAHGAPEFHADFWSFAFAPPRPPFSGTPLLYVGCDGGIATSTTYASSAPISPSPNLGEGAVVDASSGTFRSLDRGKRGSALFAMATDPRLPVLNYIGCLDTGVARGAGGLGWRGFSEADAGVLAVAPGSDGVTVWYASGLRDDFPYFMVRVGIDGGPGIHVDSQRGGALVGATSNLFTGTGDACIGGLISYGAARTLTSAIPDVYGVHEFTLDSLDGVEPGTTLMFEPDVEQRNPKMVDAIVDVAARRVRTVEGFGGYAIGTAIRVIDGYVGRIDRTGNTVPISQNLGRYRQAVFCIAASPGSSTMVACATQTDALAGDLSGVTNRMDVTDKLWTTTGGTAAASTWTEVTSGRPGGTRIANVAVDVAGTVFVLLTAAAGGTPLYRIASGAWTACAGSGIPSGFPFGRMIAHPTDANRLFAVCGARVYDVRPSGSSWTWTDLTGSANDGLPGAWVYDLWAGNIDHRPGRTKLMLRAAVATRGVYETDITPGATPPSLAYYMRDNVVDHGWLDESPSGVPNPRKPSENAWHWQCADIKVDARRPEGFFQTDPEYPATLPSYIFDVMRDYSGQLPQNAPARVHVAVRNRSRVPSTETAWLWVLWTRASAGLPRLGTAASAPDFDFWALFTGTGINHGALPPASSWKQVAPPAAVTGVSADKPVVVSLPWTVPALAPGDLGHFCLIALLHSPSRSITSFTGTETNVDAITRRNPQLGQKNLLVIPAPSPTLPESVAAAAPPPAPEQMMTIEFHNASSESREATLVFDVRNLPLSVDVAFHLSSNVTPSSVTGAKRTRRGCGCWPFRRGGALSPVRYEAGKLSLVEVKGVRLEPDQSCAARLAVRIPPETPPGEYAFDVMQVVRGVAVGGSTYVVVVPDPQAKPEPREEEDRSDAPAWVHRNVPWLMAPRWARPFVRARPDFRSLDHRP